MQEKNDESIITSIIRSYDSRIQFAFRHMNYIWSCADYCTDEQYIQKFHALTNNKELFADVIVNLKNDRYSDAVVTASEKMFDLLTNPEDLINIIYEEIRNARRGTKKEQVWEENLPVTGAFEIYRDKIFDNEDDIKGSPLSFLTYASLYQAISPFLEDNLGRIISFRKLLITRMMQQIYDNNTPFKREEIFRTHEEHDIPIRRKFTNQKLQDMMDYFLNVLEEFNELPL